MSIPFASQHTPSFPDALAQLGVSAVVSTYQAGQLIILRPRDGLLNTHFCSLERPMGVAAGPGRLAVGSGYQLLEYRDLPAVAAKLGDPDGHDACYLPRSVHVTGDIDIHELAYGESDELWLVNTRMSCLCTLEPAFSVVPRWRPPFITGYDLHDRCHLNGLALRNGKPAYVTALGRSDSRAGWRADKAHGGLLMGVPDGRVIAEGLSMPHSPRWHDGQLWLLESGAGTLVVIDPDTGGKTVVAELPGFTRGLDFVGRYAFVGLSQVRETAVFAGLPLTARVADRQCGVWVVDTVTGETIAFVVFTGSVQEVFAVQLLPHRFPALLEMSDPLLRNSYAVPDEALADVAPYDPIEQQFERALESHRAKRFDEAVAGYRTLLSHRPDDINAWWHLGQALAECEHWADGEAALRKVVAQQSGHAQACNTLGLCCAGQGRWADALAAYQKALSADSQYAEAHVNRAQLLLKLGRYEEAWKDWDWRLHLRDASRLACPQPMWDGTPIADKVLLVHAEQTAAEVIQFARFLPLAAPHCKKLILACDEDLRPLLANIPGVAEARVPDAVLLDSFDVHCPIMSLPGLLGIGLARLPGEFPYVAVPPYISVPSLRTDARRKLGICWSTAGGADGSDLGSIPYPLLSALLDVEDHAFFALQTPVSREAAAWLSEHGARNLEPELTDAARLAALIEQMDLVIGPDHTVTHLAGALGKPVWVLLGAHEGWTWLLERTDSPWYPTARLFRQSRDGGWADLIARVRQTLLEERA